MNQKPTADPKQVALAEKILTGQATLNSELTALGLQPNVGAPFDLNALIADARARLAVDGAKKQDEAIEFPDADIANTLLARRAEVERQIKELTAEKEQITSFFSDYVLAVEAQQALEPGAIAEVRVHGAPVFTYKQVTSRVLVTDAVKKMFPDTEDNAEFYTNRVTRPRNFV